ncbi:TPR-like protein [Aspergillus terreus]|uniref:TPR-like protein n=1 Tax=Aspergillus terreus TaxID=33178 RepID=A0A5M3Z5N2_ASPTE|nr:hypothetical protein ATETN484_0010004600 [Aspergillus terreus]GFF18096.1 TPR-like protein [Aspergillus terreus]
MVRRVTEDDIGLRVLYLPSEKEKAQSADEVIDIVAIHAHCFGGLVVLKALLEAYYYEDEWPGIFHSTTGLVFFGTPFRGAEGLSQVEMIEAALREYDEESVQGEVLQILAPGNEFLQDLVDKFGKLRSLPNKAEVACFFELRPSNVGAIRFAVRKTRLAAEFARKNHRRFSAVFWINGSSKQTIQQSFASIAQQIPDTELADVSRSRSLSEAAIDTSVKSILQWLSLPSNRQWLLLFDNVDHEPGDESADSGSYNLREFLPPVDHGSILITSRLKSLQQYGTYLDLQAVSDDQALRILEGNSKSQIQVIEALGGLPLALTQAGAYLRSTKMPARAWAKLYEDTWKSLMKSQCRSLLQEATHGNESALTTWNMSYARVETENSDAAHLLKLWAFLDYGHLWHGLIAHAIHLESYVEVPGWLRSLANDELRFYDAIGILTRYSLVDHLETLSTYTMHPVVHKWCSQLIFDNSARFEVIILKNMVFKYAAQGNPELAELSYNQTRTVIECDPQILETRDPHLLYYIGQTYEAQNYLAKAEELYHQVLREIRDAPGRGKELGALYLAALHHLIELGKLHQYRGNLEKAEKLYGLVSSAVKDSPVFDEKTSVLHAAVLHNFPELGELHQDHGNLEKAEKAYGQFLSSINDAPA